ncbi:MAG: type II toxin-antitoxin system PemK/MazF family toxin [Nanoarchaeota archaeon]|nr:type II toxin-antitoxin system PemK/MazF family toxin [Nanoarchaeota archaeon]
MKLIRGDIVLVNLEPSLGSEQGRKRPAVVLQNNISNIYSPTTIIAPITSKIYEKEYPTNVFLNKENSGLDKDSTLLLNQIRVIDKRRIIKKLGFLNEETMKKVDLAIKVSLYLD